MPQVASTVAHPWYGMHMVWQSSANVLGTKGISSQKLWRLFQRGGGGVLMKFNHFTVILSHNGVRTVACAAPWCGNMGGAVWFGRAACSTVFPHYFPLFPPCAAPLFEHHSQYCTVCVRKNTPGN